MGTELGGPAGVYSFVAKVRPSSTPTETISSGKVLIMKKSTKLFQLNDEEKNLFTHLAVLSELESISIGDGEGARDK